MIPLAVLLVASHEMGQDELERVFEERVLSSRSSRSSRSRQSYACTPNMDSWLSQIGVGTGPKHISERYSEYPSQAHDQQLLYSYEPPSAPHGYISSKHTYGGGGHKSNAAMSALTLLAFLFFLHILQQCLKEHMTAMSTPQVTVISAGREGEQGIGKTANKFDKAGLVASKAEAEERTDVDIKNTTVTGTKPSTDSDDDSMTRIATAEHTPRINPYRKTAVKYTNRSAIFDGFVSAMDEA